MACALQVTWLLIWKAKCSQTQMPKDKVLRSYLSQRSDFSLNTYFSWRQWNLRGLVSQTPQVFCVSTIWVYVPTFSYCHFYPPTPPYHADFGKHSVSQHWTRSIYNVIVILFLFSFFSSHRSMSWVYVWEINHFVCCACVMSQLFQLFDFISPVGWSSNTTNPLFFFQIYIYIYMNK